jgi:hypothetical protein
MRTLLAAGVMLVLIIPYDLSTLAAKRVLKTTNGIGYVTSGHNHFPFPTRQAWAYLTAAAFLFRCDYPVIRVLKDGCPTVDPNRSYSYWCLELGQVDEDDSAMMDFSDVPEWLLEQHPDDRFLEALIEDTAAVINRLGEPATPLLAMALDARPRNSVIELSLQFNPQLGNRSDLEAWDQRHISAAGDLVEVWQPVRDAFLAECERWQSLHAAHPKGGSLYNYTLLVLFVFNLDSGPIADALDRLAARDLEIYAINREDPAQPNVFEVEHGRVTLRDRSPEPEHLETHDADEPEERWQDPDQLELF